MAVEDGPDLVATTTYTDTPSGYQITETDFLGTVASVTDFDALARPVKLQGRGAPDIERTYDANSNLEIETQGKLRTTYSYDVLNRVETISDAMDNTRRMEYDGNGNLRFVYDAKGNEPTEHIYDERNRLMQTNEPGGGTLLYGFDEVNNLVRLTDQEGSVTTFDYDAANRQVSDTNEYGSRQFGYDPAGNLVQLIDRNGRQTNWAFDGNNLPVSETWLDSDGESTHSITSTYDAIGRLTSIGDSGGLLTWDYLGRDRPTEESQHDVHPWRRNDRFRVHHRRARQDSRDGRFAGWCDTAHANHEFRSRDGSSGPTVTIRARFNDQIHRVWLRRYHRIGRSNQPFHRWRRVWIVNIRNRQPSVVGTDHSLGSGGSGHSQIRDRFRCQRIAGATRRRRRHRHLHAQRQRRAADRNTHGSPRRVVRV